MPARPKPLSSARARSLVALLALLALCAVAIAAPAAHAADAHYEGISAASDVAVFSTIDKLVSGDTDIQGDVYVRDFEEGLGYVTRAVSLGPTGGNDAFEADFLAIDPASLGVFFSTRERLTSTDKDSATDVYVRDLTENETTLVSAGDASCAASGCGAADIGVSPVEEVFDEGRATFFVTTESLSSADQDSGADVYRRDLVGEETTLISVPDPSCSGSCGAGASPVVFRGASDDGSKAIFTTGESLSGEDDDEEVDLYERDLTGAGETRLVSTPGSGLEPCPSGATCTPATGKGNISPDGSHVFFETNERIAVADTDAKQDVYNWSGGTATLASVGPAGENGPGDARFLAGAANGSKVFFATADPLDAADTDSAEDVYVRAGGSTELVSEGDPSCAPSECGNGAEAAKLEWASPDGALAVLTTAESLTEADTDSNADIYSRALPGGPTALVSLPGPSCKGSACGNEAHDAGFAGASTDGSSLFFVIDEALAPAEPEGDPFAFGDSDDATDVYERAGGGGGTTTLISLGQQNEGGEYRGNEEQPAQLRGVSADGDLPYFTTDEQLSEADVDADEDLYVRVGAATLLVSRGNSEVLEAELAPPGPTLARTDPESPAAATLVRVIGSEPDSEASIKIYSSPDCTGQPIGTGSAKTLEEPGIAVTVGIGTTTSFRATAEADGFVSPCSGMLSYTQKAAASGVGSAAPSKKAPEPGPLIRLPRLVPETRITFGPAFKTRARRPVFRFTDATGQADTSFECKLDRSRWKPCGSPIKLKKLDRGRHAFAVLGVNADGVAEEQPVKRRFKVVSR
jgi:hypothetical protein